MSVRVEPGPAASAAGGLVLGRELALAVLRVAGMGEDRHQGRRLRPPLGRKLVREWRRGHLSIELRAAASVPARDDQFSDLRVRYAGRKVLDLQWSAAGVFKAVTFEPGGWQGGLSHDKEARGITTAGRS